MSVSIEPWNVSLVEMNAEGNYILDQKSRNSSYWFYRYTDIVESSELSWR